MKGRSCGKSDKSQTTRAQTAEFSVSFRSRALVKTYPFGVLLVEEVHPRTPDGHQRHEAGLHGLVSLLVVKLLEPGVLVCLLLGLDE